MWPQSGMHERHVWLAARAKWSVILGVLAVVTAAALGSRELHAGRDAPGELLEQVAALERVNAALAEQARADREELAALHRRLLALEGRAAEPAGAAGTSKPGSQSPGGAAQSAIEAHLEFRRKVLAAIEPELAGIDARLAATLPRAEFDKHFHTFEKVAPKGYYKVSQILTCPSCLLPYMPGDDPSSLLTEPTSKPKK